jgi:hypothetical protein
VGRDECLLDGVLGLVLGAQHVAAEAEHSGGVALVEDLEGGLVTGAHKLDQAVVGPQDEQPLWPADRTAGVDRHWGNALHELIVLLNAPAR